MTAPLLHVIGAGPWQVPTIRRARSLGLRVLVSDGWEERPGHAIADLRERASIVDAEATLAAARRHDVAGVLCDTTDNGVFAAAYVAESLGLPGIGAEAARNCTDKSRMADRAQAAGLPVPQWRRIGSFGELVAAEAALGSPVVVKPVDSQSGRGVSVVDAAAQLRPAYDCAMAHSRSHTALVQRLATGTEVIVDSIVAAGRVHRLGLAVKSPYADNPTVSSRITYGASRPPAPPEVIDAANAALIAALGVRQGLVHAEYMVADGQVVPIDVAARGGGVMIYGRVLPAVSGIDAMRAAIELALGRPADLRPAHVPRAANVEFLRAPPGLVVAVGGVDEARAMPGVAAVHLNIGVGQRMGALNHKDDRLGFVIAVADDAETAIALSRAAAARIEVRIAADEGVSA